MLNRIQHRILIIDDDLDLLMLLERRLQKEGYEIETAASLPEAEEIIASFAPHMVLLDINVNGEDGRQLCWKLKMTDHTRDIKVIIMSGYDYSTGRAVLFGANELLPKPLNMEFLFHRIESLLGIMPGSSSLLPGLNESLLNKDANPGLKALTRR
ncbi:MAG TPA: response regulator [Flavisolibacter sp.]|nr:response regulator [Flavisolibacter sp.]